MVVLMLAGMLARIRKMEVLVRRATVPWDQLREPLGFCRDSLPAPSRSAGLWPNAAWGQFQAAFGAWLQSPTAGVIRVFLCPDDRLPTNPVLRGGWLQGLTSYGGNGGTRVMEPAQATTDGIFHTTGPVSESAPIPNAFAPQA